MRKVYLTLTVSLIVEIEEGTSVDSVVSELDCDINYSVDECASVIDCQIEGYNITDSK